MSSSANTVGDQAGVLTTVHCGDTGDVEMTDDLAPSSQVLSYHHPDTFQYDEDMSQWIPHLSIQIYKWNSEFDQLYCF